MRYYSQRLLLFLALLLGFCFQIHAQIFWTETFGTACSQGNTAHGTVTSNGTWTVSNVGLNEAFANQFFISATEAGMGAGNCGDGCLANAALTNRTLHVANVAGSPASLFCGAGDCGAAYDAVPATAKRAESPTIDCSAYNTISVSFDYMMQGEAGNDEASLWYFDGVSWAALVNPLALTPCCGGAPCGLFVQGQWANSGAIALPASADGNSNVKIAFRWVNDNNNSGSDPSFAVDDIVLQAPIILPVEMTNFEAIKLSDEVKCTWTTASEIASSHFVLEHSIDNQNWEKVGTVPAAGNSTGLHSYSFTHQQPSPGNNYYRLQQVDLNGKVHFSRSKVVFWRALSELEIYPNPARDLIQVYFGNTYENIKIDLYSTTGQLLRSFKTASQESHETSLNLEGIPAGVYFLHVRTSEKQSTVKRIVVQ